MYYTLASNGTNSRHDAMRYTGQMFIYVTTGGLDGSYQKLFSASVIHLKDTDQLDISLIHGDGSNTVVKKGVPASVTQDTNTKKVTKNSS